MPLGVPLPLFLAALTGLVIAVSKGAIHNPLQAFFNAPITDIVDEDLRIVNSTCEVLARAVSIASDVYFPGTVGYDIGVRHWVESSTQHSTCTVEPGSAEDIGKILQILGWTQTPFAIKGGGHSYNPDFSSTTGVQIAMSRFNHLSYDAEAQTADIGAGLRWDAVYELLNPQGVTVLGGRTSGVGVAGFILGGGLSWKTNQYGWSLDSVVAYDLVLPNGTFVSATADHNTDLFFGLRGGLNNFGIVTKFTLKTYPQTDVWGGVVIVPESELESAYRAIANYAANNTDPKAVMNVLFEYSAGALVAYTIIFYDAPTPPDGIFDELLSIPNCQTSIATMPFLSILKAGTPVVDTRRLQNEAPMEKYTAEMLKTIANETLFWGKAVAPFSGSLIQHIVEIFLPSYYSHGTDSAFPPDREHVVMPINLVVAWSDPSADEKMYQAMVQSAAYLRVKAIEESQDVANVALYPNIAVYGTPLEDMYGSNLERLRKIRAVYDPARVMDLAGGWKF